MSMVKMVMRKFCRSAEGHPERLPCHREDPPRILTAAVAARNGRVFDSGCLHSLVGGTPELRLVDVEVADFAAPLPFGPTVRGAGYWFRQGMG